MPVVGVGFSSNSISQPFSNIRTTIDRSKVYVSIVSEYGHLNIYNIVLLKNENQIF